MIKHYLKYSLRNIKSNRLVVGGSVMTIVLAVLCISLLFSYLQNELSIDNFHKRKDQIYLLTNRASDNSLESIIDASLFFKFNYENYSEIENLVNLMKYNMGEIKFSCQNQIWSPEGLIADSTFFEVFDFKLILGDVKTVLNDPTAIVLTKELADKMFGEVNPIGKVITVTTNREVVLTVKGIADNPPSNSSLDFDFIIPSHSSRFSRSGANFILVNEDFDSQKFCEQIKDIGNVHFQFKNTITTIFPFKDVYYEGQHRLRDYIFSRHGDYKSIYILFIIIGVTFIISLLNFTNLQIININTIFKNIGIMKVAGASSRQLVIQKGIEIAIIILFSAVIITALYTVVLPQFNDITGVSLSPKFWQIFLLNLLILVVLVTIDMIYHTYTFLRISISNSLRKLFTDSKLTGRKIVVIVQFTLSFVLLIASMVVANQLKLMLSKDLGFDSKNTIRTKLFHREHFSGSNEEYMKRRDQTEANFQFVQNELASHSVVNSYTQGLSPIRPFKMNWKKKGGDMDFTTQNCLVGVPGYKSFFDLQLLEGRFFERDKDEQRSGKVVINEAAKKFWDIEDFETARLVNKSWSRKGEGFEIIGVVKNFHCEHLSKQPQPLVMLYFEDYEDDFFIRFEEGAQQSGIQLVEQLFQKINPGESFHYSFLNDEVEDLYQKEKRLGKIYILFTIVAFIISAIGLFAIALYDTRKRTKEIGVRKVNGASVKDVLILLNKDFIQWIGIAYAISCPIAYYFMDKWLQDFAYKTPLSWWIFISAGLISLLICFATVSWQTRKAASQNPVQALRYE